MVTLLLDANSHVSDKFMLHLALFLQHFQHNYFSMLYGDQLTLLKKVYHISVSTWGALLRSCRFYLVVCTCYLDTEAGIFLYLMHILLLI